jgi:DNA polymerase-4
MDAFFASVEQRDNPDLKGKPIAVGGDGRRGVVAAASYEARKFGVRSAMASSVAKRLCPQLIFVRGNYERYKEVSNQIRAIFLEYTDLVQMVSVDEAYLDVTENKLNLHSGTLIAEQIRAKIFEQTQLTASAGVSYCKFLAKVASDINKPNGLKVIRPEEAEAFLEALPVEKFHGIGKATADKMHKIGIVTGRDLKKRSLLDLSRRFGKAGRFYYDIVRGIDKRPVETFREIKSISAERTFDEDISELDQMMEALDYIARKLVERLDRKDRKGRTLTLKVKYADFKIVTRSFTSDSYISSAAEMVELARPLLLDTEIAEKKVRLLGLGLSNLNEDPMPLSYWFGKQLEFDFEVE